MRPLPTHLLSIPAETYIIRPLGNPPHDVLDRLAPGLRHKIPQGRARASLPALWAQEKYRENKAGYLALIPPLTRSGSSDQTYAQGLAMRLLGQ